MYFITCLICNFLYIMYTGLNWAKIYHMPYTLGRRMSMPKVPAQGMHNLQTTQGTLTITESVLHSVA